jgi:hypothetical protein
MSYSLNRFLRPLKNTDKTIRIFDDRNYPVHTINPFSVIRVFVTNSNLNIALSGNRTIVLDFPNHDETKQSLAKLQSFIDELRKKSPDVIDKQTEVYVDKIIQVSGGLYSLNGLTASNQKLIASGDENIDIDVNSSGFTHSINLTWTGILPIERGGLNNSDFSEGELLIPDDGKIISSGYTINDDVDSDSNLWSANRIKLEIKNETDIFSYKEKPIGLVDGLNSEFYLENTPADGTEHIFLNGLLQNFDYDYTLEDNKIIFFEAPPANSIILCSYKKITIIID